MKLIVAGATGFVGSEIIRQSLRMPQVTSIVALSRKPIKVEDGTETSKLKNLVLKDYGEYPDDVKSEFEGADACIWTVAITPTRSKGIDFAEVKRVCQDCTLAGFRAMSGARPGKPFRFVYMSGVAAERDPNKKASYMPEYSAMRGETEVKILALAAEHNGEAEACVAKPGRIMDGQDYPESISAPLGNLVITVPTIGLDVLSAAMLQQVLCGFEKEPLMNDDLARIGKKALEA